MKHYSVLAVAFVSLLATGCQRPAGTVHPTAMKSDLVFLTRDDCVNTPDMLLNVDDALRALKLPLDYQVINLKNLPLTDARVGYPTPTVLYKNHDLFDMPVPAPPFPEPS